MQGLMMNVPLTMPMILRRAKYVHPSKEIITRLAAGGVHRYTYGEFYQRVLRLMGALRAMGVKPGDRIATLAWNHYRNLELYFAVPCLGAVLHTLNLRLSPDQLEYIINDAEDRWIFVDDVLTSMLQPLQDKCPGVKGFVVLQDGRGVPSGDLRNAATYEDLLAAAEPIDAFPDLDENSAAAMCYTSGTTGNPKGVLYSHRAIFLHTMAQCLADSAAISESDRLLLFVPMFHANGWGFPHAAVMTGATLLLPATNPHAVDVVAMIQAQKATAAAGVPTIWNMVHRHLQSEGGDISSLTRIICGGSAVPRSMFKTYLEQYGVPILHLWGMTELTPLGTISRLRQHMYEWPEERQYDVRIKQGVPVPGVELRIIGPDETPLPHDGTQVGELVARGPWVISSYYNRSDRNSFTRDGWFRTGDVARIDPDGYMQIADRVKDVIKSGGEWISSVDMENLLASHSKVLEAAVVARPDEKWDERPVAFIVPAEGPQSRIPYQEIVQLLETAFAKWQVPYEEDVHFIDAVPKTSVGKFDKKVLRLQMQPRAKV